MTSARDIFRFALRLAPYFLRYQQGAQAATADDIAKAHTLQKIRVMDGGVILIVGRRGSGKTTLAIRLAQFIGKPTYMVSPHSKVPSWIQRIDFENLETVPAQSVLILDDVPTYASQRDYHEQTVKAMEKMIPMCRHWKESESAHPGLVIIFATQSSGLADKYIMDVDALFLKPFSILFQDLERTSIRKLAEEAMPKFEALGDEEEWKKWAYLVTHSYKGMIRTGLPT